MMPSSSTSIKDKVNKYIETTTKIKKIQAQIAPLRQKLKAYEERKKKLTPHIINYISQQGGSKPSTISSKSYSTSSSSKGFNYQNYKFTAFTSKRTQSISKDYLDKTLTTYFNGDKKKAQNLLDHIYNSRKVTQTQVLRQTELKKKKN